MKARDVATCIVVAVILALFGLLFTGCEDGEDGRDGRDGTVLCQTNAAGPVTMIPVMVASNTDATVNVTVIVGDGRVQTTDSHDRTEESTE